MERGRDGEREGWRERETEVPHHFSHAREQLAQ